MEVLRIVDETLEAFFLLPIPMHPALLPDLVTGLDKCLQYYVTKAKSGCGNITEHKTNFLTLNSSKFSNQ